MPDKRLFINNRERNPQKRDPIVVAPFILEAISLLLRGKVARPIGMKERNVFVMLSAVILKGNLKIFAVAVELEPIRNNLAGLVKPVAREALKYVSTPRFVFEAAGGAPGFFIPDGAERRGPFVALCTPPTQFRKPVNVNFREALAAALVSGILGICQREQSVVRTLRTPNAVIPNAVIHREPLMAFRAPPVHFRPKVDIHLRKTLAATFISGSPGVLDIESRAGGTNGTPVVVGKHVTRHRKPLMAVRTPPVHFRLAAHIGVRKALAAALLSSVSGIFEFFTSETFATPSTSSDRFVFGKPFVALCAPPMHFGFAIGVRFGKAHTAVRTSGGLGILNIKDSPTFGAPTSMPDAVAFGEPFVTLCTPPVHF